jgi:hypothetical protein
MPARALPSTKSQLVIEEALARKPKTRKVLVKIPKEAEIWRQEALASKATNPKTGARVFPSAKTSTLQTPAKTFQTTKASTRKDLARERLAREIPAEKSKTVELWRQEVLRTPITPKIPRKAPQSSKVPTARDLARERMTFEIPAEAFHTVDVPDPRQVYPLEITAEDIMAGDSCSEFSWEEALDDDDKDEADVEEAFVEDAKMGGVAYKVSIEDLLMWRVPGISIMDMRCRRRG